MTDAIMSEFRFFIERLKIRYGSDDYWVETFSKIHDSEELKKYLVGQCADARIDVHSTADLFDKLADTEDERSDLIRMVPGLCAKILLIRLGKEA